MVELLLKGFFLAYRWPSSCCVPTWERKEASMKGGWGEREREESGLFFSL